MDKQYDRMTVGMAFPCSVPLSLPLLFSPERFCEHQPPHLPLPHALLATHTFYTTQLQKPQYPPQERARSRRACHVLSAVPLLLAFWVLAFSGPSSLWCCGLPIWCALRFPYVPHYSRANSVNSLHRLLRDAFLWPYYLLLSLTRDFPSLTSTRPSLPPSPPPTTHSRKDENGPRSPLREGLPLASLSRPRHFPNQTQRKLLSHERHIVFIFSF